MDLVAPFVPPHLQAPARELPLGAFLRAIRTNALTMWPERAYRDDVMVRGLLGRTNMLINAPDAIHRVLVENSANYRRSPASVPWRNSMPNWRLFARKICNAPCVASRVRSRCS